MARVITLLTDFGTQDAYVASMKGTILSVAPTASLVDITHAIAPQDLYAAAFILGASYEYFPPETIHLVVVDPGVGAQRHVLLLQTPEALFLAPDNGVLAYVLDAYGAAKNMRAPHAEPVLPPPAVQVPLPAPLKAFAITNSQLFRPQVSQTFHGRDIFAPVAAHLSLGLDPASVGPPLTAVTTLVLPRPYRNAAGELVGAIVHVDVFGNLITNLGAAELPEGELTVRLGGRTISGLSASYATGSDLLAIVGSSGYLEVAAKNGSAAEELGLGRWAMVTVWPTRAGDSP